MLTAVQRYFTKQKFSTRCNILVIVFSRKGMNYKQRKSVRWLVLILLVVAIKVLSIKPSWVEAIYTYGVYPFIARVQRVLLGWVPFSIGDIFYVLVLLSIFIICIKGLKAFYKRRISRSTFRRGVVRVIFFWALIFVAFYGLWGLNYSRQGIASQLNLEEKKYAYNDLDTLVHLLHTRLNHHASQITPAIRDSFKSKRNLFKSAPQMYTIVEKQYPFLKYKNYSVKPSLFSYIGNYFGFQGYYNPFTGEAQVNTTIPLCLEPFVTAHEIAHQLGYAKESEANFVGFLACRLHPSEHFKYSVYFEMFQYAIKELHYVDSVRAQSYLQTLHPLVQKDIRECREFYQKYSNPIEPYIAEAYSYFLKANNQPKGKASYNEVVMWLIAYYKRYGTTAI